MSHIPVVDFKEYGLMYPSAEEARLNKAFDRIAKEVLHAFKDVGFVYLKNTGISSEQQENIFRTGDEFFGLPWDVKNKYRASTHYTGWTSLLQERTNPDRPNDLVESYRIYLPEMTTKTWPTVELPDFKDTMLAFNCQCTELAYRVLDVVSHGLGLEDPTYLRKHHSMHKSEPFFVLRLLRYPALTGRELEPGQSRIGEHTDSGSITLVFQDEAGGLEVQCRDGVFRPATPIPDTVLINTGYLLQHWTSDVLVANRHRVALPEEHQRGKARRSVAFFVNPDYDSVIECLDGSNKYPPVTTGEFLDAKLKKIITENTTGN